MHKSCNLHNFFAKNRTVVFKFSLDMLKKKFDCQAHTLLAC